MHKSERRNPAPPRAEPPPRATEDPTSSEREIVAHASTMSTIKSEYKLSVDAEAARLRNIAREYGDKHVQLAPLPGDVTREQEYAAHEDTVTQIMAEMLEQQAGFQPRPKPQGLDDASIDLIKSEMKRMRVRGLVSGAK